MWERAPGVLGAGPVAAADWCGCLLRLVGLSRLVRSAWRGGRWCAPVGKPGHEAAYRRRGAGVRAGPVVKRGADLLPVGKYHNSPAWGKGANGGLSLGRAAVPDVL